MTKHSLDFIIYLATEVNSIFSAFAREICKQHAHNFATILFHFRDM
jgi:hypothetical protein